MESRRKYYFHYDASLRIVGCGNQHSSIVAKTGLVPTHSHIKGDKAPRARRAFDEDLWVLTSPLSPDIDIHQHIDWVWERVKPHRTFFSRLLRNATLADLVLGCETNCAWPMIHVDNQRLRIVRDLNLSIAFNFTVGPTGHAPSPGASPRFD